MFSTRVTLLAFALAAAACGESDATLSQPKPKPSTTTTATATNPDPTTSCGASCPVTPPADAAPAVAITEPASNANLSTKSVRVKGTASDDQPGIYVELSADGASWKPVLVSNGTFELDLPLPALDGDFLTLRARGKDFAGHLVEALQIVKVDNVGPTATVDAIPTAPPTAWLAGVPLEGKAEDTSSPVTVRVDVGDGRGFQSVPVAAGRWKKPYVADGSEDSASRTVQVEVKDAFGNLSVAAKTFTVDVVAPRITITSPLQNQKFNAADLAATGTVPVRFSVLDGDPAVIVREVGKTIPISGLEVNTLATDDGVAYSVQLEAIDSAGNRNTESIDFKVDRVAPRVTNLSPADGELVDLGAAVVKFSEPVQALQPAVSSSPSGPAGNWWPDRKAFEIPLTQADTAYTLTMGALADDFGNLLAAPAPWRITTRPMLPANETVIATNVHRFDAAADEDGVLTVIATEGSSAVRTFRVDTRTGQFIAEPVQPMWVGSQLRAWAHRSRIVGQSPSRVSGSLFIAPSGARIDYWQNGAAQAPVYNTGALLPAPALDGEGPNLGRVGFFRNQLYERQGRQSLAVAVRPDEVAFVDGRWEVVQLNPQGFSRQTFKCERPFPNAPLECSLTPVDSINLFGSTPKYSHAVTRFCSFHVYNDTAGNRSMYTEPFPASCRLGSCPAPQISTWNMQDDLMVGTGNATTAVSARRTSFGVAVQDFTPDASCNPVLGPAFALSKSNIAAFKPVRIRERPALVWLDTSGALHLFSP